MWKQVEIQGQFWGRQGFRGGLGGQAGFRAVVGAYTVPETDLGADNVLGAVLGGRQGFRGWGQFRGAGLVSGAVFGSRPGVKGSLWGRLARCI